MSEQKHEALSALVDGELVGEDGPELLDEVLDDATLKRRWAAYHLIGDVMRQHIIDGQVLDGQDEAGPVSADVAKISPRVSSGVRSWAMHPLAGLALAASVAAVAVLGIFAVSSNDPQPPVQVAATGGTDTTVIPGSDDPTVVILDAGLDPARMTWNDVAPGVTHRLNGYLVTHNEMLGNRMRGMLPYARIVAYDGGSN